MRKEILEFYSSLRQIFGVCPECEDIFRLSDCKLYQKDRKKPTVDWKEKIDADIFRLQNLEDKLMEKIELAKEAARQAGRKEADKQVRKIDKIFSPLKLNPNDAKVIFHPVDFVVFNGMHNTFSDTGIKNLLLLDHGNKQGEYATVQKSVITTIEKQNYEWLTLRVEADGSIVEE